jgi:hypothetical protein
VVAVLVGAAGAYALQQGEVDDAREERDAALTATIERTTTTTEEPASTTSTTEADEPGAAAFGEGRHFGFVKAVGGSGDDRTISFDLAQLLTGDEADEAAAEAGDIEPGEEVPNDVFVRNENPRLRELPVAPDAVIRGSIQLNGESPPLQPATFDDIEQFLAESPDDSAGLPVHVLVADGVVIAIVEQFFP